MDPYKLPESTSFPALVNHRPHPYLRNCYIPTNPFFPTPTIKMDTPPVFDRVPQSSADMQQEPQYKPQTGVARNTRSRKTRKQ